MVSTFITQSYPSPASGESRAMEGPKLRFWQNTGRTTGAVGTDAIYFVTSEHGDKSRILRLDGANQAPLASKRAAEARLLRTRLLP